MPKYTIHEQIAALNWLDDAGNYEAVSEKTAIPINTLKKWVRNRESLENQYTHWLRTDGARTMAQVQNRLAGKSAELINLFAGERLENAPLNQVASALGVLIDRYIKLQEVLEENDARQQSQIIRYQYQYPDGSIHDAPPWTIGDHAAPNPLQGSGVWQTLRQDGIGKTYPNGSGRDARSANVVVGANIPDGEPGMARSEDDDDGRDWYHD